MKNFYLMVSTLMLTGMMSAEAAGIDTLRTQQLQDVQVISTRATKKTPMAFTNMTQEQLKEVNHGQDVPYLLSLTPSVTITSDAGNGIGYTSLRVRGTDPSRINITANGVPLNDPESSTVFWVNMGDFASSMQSMQIQRGVGTSTNGAGAFGATLNMLTENIGAKPYLGIDLGGGSYYSHKETVRFSTGLLKGRWGVQGRLSNIGSKGYLDRASTKLNSYLLQGGYFGDNTVVKLVTWNGEEETYHAWNYTSKYEQSLYGRTYNSCGVMSWDTEGNPSAYYKDQTDNYHQQNYQLIWNQAWNSNLNSNITLHYTKGKGYYQQYQSEVQWAQFGMSVDENLYNDLVDQQKMDNDFYGTVASLTYDNKQGLQAILGGGWNYYKGRQYGHIVWTKPDVHTTVPEPASLSPDFEYYSNHSRKTDFNIYGKVNYELLRGLNAYVDLQYRYVHYKLQNPTEAYGLNKDGKYLFDNTYNFFNPKFGLNYDITRQHRVYVSYGIANKEPVRNNFKQQASDPSVKPKAERLYDLEAGYKFQSEKFSAGVNLYWMNYKDQLVLTGELNAIGEPLTRNIDKSYRLGVELEAAWQPVKWFRWDVNATFSRNRVRDAVVALREYNSSTEEFDDAGTAQVGDAPLAYSPSRIFNNNLTFTYKGFKASIQSRAISKQYLTNSGFDTMTGWDEQGGETRESITLGAHFTTNLDLSYNFSVKEWGMKDATVGITMYNLFSSKFDNNGWASPYYHKVNGKVEAYNGSYFKYNALRDMWAAGFAPSAPFNAMAYLSVNF